MGRWLDRVRLLNQPLHMVLLALVVQCVGSARARERFGLLTGRPMYAYGLFRAADLARWCGCGRVTAVEFGVASGSGLLAMVEAAEHVRRETGVEVRVVGFDTAEGLPPPRDHRDHPELWSEGDFAMPDHADLRARLHGRAELILGNITDTVGSFVRTLTPECPLGFVSVDVDLYSSTVPALRVFEADDPAVYLPAVSVYLDDVAMFTANRWCGELAAIEEFNEAHDLRKFDLDRTLPGRRPYPHLNWYARMRVLHVLDHPRRRRPEPRRGLALEEDQRRLREFGLM
ncbi:MAG: hypothetical protein N2652_04940 [Kiritimatiellae bacterium]|nr:hypothetical protein [Kiritimatiellia bacterium]